jgi:hypothetical protein
MCVRLSGREYGKVRLGVGLLRGYLGGEFKRSLFDSVEIFG